MFGAMMADGIERMKLNMRPKRRNCNWAVKVYILFMTNSCSWCSATLFFLARYIFSFCCCQQIETVMFQSTKIKQQKIVRPREMRLMKFQYHALLNLIKSFYQFLLRVYVFILIIKSICNSFAFVD